MWPHIPWSNPERQPVIRNKALKSSLVPDSPLLGSNLLTLFFPFSFQNYIHVIPFIVLPHENEQQAKHFSSKVIFDTFFFYVSYTKKRKIWHMGCGAIQTYSTLLKMLRFQGNWEINGMSIIIPTPSINFKLLSTLKRGENLKVFFMKLQKLHIW